MDDQELMKLSLVLQGGVCRNDRGLSRYLF
jgi:hypothetical protein